MFIYTLRVTGAGTALISREAAMACTVAVEEVISDHYNDQLRTLNEREDTRTSEVDLQQVFL